MHKLTAKERLKAGLWYDANFDEELLKERIRANSLVFKFNSTDPAEEDKRQSILRELLGSMGEGACILEPFHCDYGYNIKIGDGTFINHSAYLMDCAPITIGSHCFIGPNAGMYTAAHPLLAAERNEGYEKASPIVIKDNVWLGGNVVILPGVTVGEGAVIGAGAVVTKDVPPQTIVVGSPAKVLRKITETDSIAAYLN